MRRTAETPLQASDQQPTTLIISVHTETRIGDAGKTGDQGIRIEVFTKDGEQQGLSTQTRQSSSELRSKLTPRDHQKRLVKKWESCTKPQTRKQNER